MAPPKKSQTEKKLAALTKQVLADPNTARIAEKLGIPLEEYVQQVVYFATHPKAEPNLLVVRDADLRAMGRPPPDENEMGRYLIEAVKMGEATSKTEYSDPEKRLVTMSDLPAGKPDTRKANPRLKAELDRQLRGKRGGKT